MDRIPEQARSIIPVTWDALSQDGSIGDPVLFARVDYAQARILGSILDTAEQDALNDLVVEFVAKYAVLQIIDPAIDYWMTQEETLTTTGTAEVVAYTSRIAALKELKANILAELAELAPVVGPLIPNVTQNRSRPLLSSIDDELLTPNPQDLGPPYGALIAR